MRKGTRQFGKGERSAESEETAEHPHKQIERFTRNASRNTFGSAGGSKDARTDGRADQHGNGAQQSEAALQSERFAFRRRRSWLLRLRLHK